MKLRDVYLSAIISLVYYVEDVNYISVLNYKVNSQKLFTDS